MHKLIFGIFFSALFSACQPADKSSNEQDDNARIDTAQVIADMNIRKKIFTQELFDTDSAKGLQQQIDTIELMYIAFACDCPRWVVAAEYNRIDSLNNGKHRDPTDNFVEFNDAEFSYYLEPADKKLTLPDYVEVNGNRIRFTGRKYLKSGYPANADFMDPNPTKGNVFRYYGYEIIKPFKVWGPQVSSGEADNSVIIPSELLVK